MLTTQFKHLNCIKKSVNDTRSKGILMLFLLPFLFSFFLMSYRLGFRFMVFNVTFNNMSVISWRISFMNVHKVYLGRSSTEFYWCILSMYLYLKNKYDLLNIICIYVNCVFDLLSVILDLTLKSSCISSIHWTGCR